MTGRAAFAEDFGVPRETMTKLDRYAELLTDWQQRMNLVGPSTLPHVWERHFADSAQLARLAPLNMAHRPVWLDVGAGGGFPGIVLALLGAGSIQLVESIAKKTRFLQAVIDDLGLGDRAKVHHGRVEAIGAFRCDVITARACASLAQLFDWGRRFAAPSAIWILPKGESVETELSAARLTYIFESELVRSVSDPRGQIVVAKGVRHK